MCFSNRVCCFDKFLQLRGTGALRAPMKGKLAPSPGWLFSHSPSVIYMEGTGLPMDEHFPRGHISLHLSWSSYMLLCSGVSLLIDRLEGLDAPLLPLSLTQFITSMGRSCFLSTLAMLPSSSQPFHHLTSQGPFHSSILHGLSASFLQKSQALRVR